MDRIHRFGLTGFKAFKDTVWLPIQPITVLAGLNSSGKSSVIDAILLLTQTLRAEKRVAENIVLDWSGPFFEVDYFQEMVYHFPVYRACYDNEILSQEFSIDFEIPIVINHKSLVQNRVTERREVNELHSLLRIRFVFRVELKFESDEFQNSVTHYDIDLKAYSGTNNSIANHITIRHNESSDLVYISNSEHSTKVNRGQSLNFSYFLPVWEEKEELITTDEDKKRFEIYTLYRDLFQPTIKTIQDELLYRIKYLGPLRHEPQRSYRQKRLPGIDVGAKGEDAVSLLQRHWQKQVDFVQLPQDSQEIVAWEKLLPVKMPLGEAVNEALRWLGMQNLRVQEGFGVVRADFATLSDPKRWVTIADVGFGVSQVLPVLVLGLLSETDSILIFEQPEIHLHPRAQARLGELLVCLAKTGRRVLIETHSDHLINRLRRVVAEDLSDQLSDLVSIVFVTPPANGEGAKLEPLRVNEEGLIENWPEDFLAETTRDARAIVKAGIRKRRMAKQA